MKRQVEKALSPVKYEKVNERTRLVQYTRLENLHAAKRVTTKVRRWFCACFVIFIAIQLSVVDQRERMLRFLKSVRKKYYLVYSESSRFWKYNRVGIGNVIVRSSLKLEESVILFLMDRQLEDGDAFAVQYPTIWRLANDPECIIFSMLNTLRYAYFYNNVGAMSRSY